MSHVAALSGTARVHARDARDLAGRLGRAVHHVDAAAEVEDAHQDEHERDDHERELDERLTAAAACRRRKRTWRFFISRTSHPRPVVGDDGHRALHRAERVVRVLGLDLVLLCPSSRSPWMRYVQPALRQVLRGGGRVLADDVWRERTRLRVGWASAWASACPVRRRRRRRLGAVILMVIVGVSSPARLMMRNVTMYVPGSLKTCVTWASPAANSPSPKSQR